MLCEYMNAARIVIVDITDRMDADRLHGPYDGATVSTVPMLRGYDAGRIDGFADAREGRPIFDAKPSHWTDDYWYGYVDGYGVGVASDDCSPVVVEPMF